MNAVKLRNRILERFEAADRDPTLIEDGALNFVIVGAGPTGVETAGALADLFYNLLPRDYHQLATQKARVIIVEMTKEVLAPFKDNLRAYAKEELEQRRVEVRLGEAVAEVGPTFVRLKSGEEIQAHTLIWAAGVRANPLADLLGLPQGRGGRIKLNPDLSVPDHPEIFVVGDMGEVASDGEVLPQLGSVAMQSGSTSGNKLPAAYMVSRPSHSSIGIRALWRPLGEAPQWSSSQTSGRCMARWPISPGWVFT